MAGTTPAAASELMAMTQRERTIALVTGAAVGLFAVNRYAIDPYIDARKAVNAQRDLVVARQTEVTKTFAKQKRLKGEWDAMVSGGLKSDAGDAEQQLYDAVRDFAHESSVTILTSDAPQRVPQKERTQIVRLRVSGKGTTAAFSKMLWKVETSPLPLKVDEFTLTGQGNDDLNVTLVVSTIWLRPPSPDDNKPRPGVAVPRRPAGDDL
jgi:hypothetical protein